MVYVAGENYWDLLRAQSDNRLLGWKRSAAVVVVRWQPAYYVQVLGYGLLCVQALRSAHRFGDR